MKNLFGKFASFAVCLSVATAFTACHQEYAPDPQEQLVHEDVVVELNTTRTLVVNLTGNGASAATVKYAGQSGSRSGNTVTFENAAASGKVNVTGSTIIARNADVKFGERSTIVMEVNAVLASTNIVPQATADAGGDVKNDNSNQSTTGVGANLNLGTNGSTADYSGVSGSKNYSLTVLTQPVAPVENIAQNVTYTFAPYSVVCKPDGAVFTPAARVDLTVDGVGAIGAEGIKFVFENDFSQEANKTVSASDVISADVPHFSTWNVFITATCTGITEGEEVIKRGSLVNGENTVTFDQKVGFSSSEKGIIAVWLKMAFGASLTKVSKTTTINSTGEGTYAISQPVYTVSFKAGNKTFEVKTYGEPTCSVTYTGTVAPQTEPVVPSHNGGSND